MGSIEEDELVRMVQDFIESESTSSTSSTSSNCHASNHPTYYFVLQDILKSQGDAAAETKVLKYVLKHMRRKQNSEETTTDLRRWLVMRMNMDGLNVSLCQTSWSTSLGCPAGEYESIEVISEDGKYANPLRLIVDIDFRSQFELARPTLYYKELTDSLPIIFVGTENKLSKIISLLCSAAKRSLKEKGLHVPPWRTTTYMKSKWLSSGCRKEHGTGRDNFMGRKGGDGIIGKWVPPMVKPKKRDLRGGSGLSTQLLLRLTTQER